MKLNWHTFAGERRAPAHETPAEIVCVDFTRTKKSKRSRYVCDKCCSLLVRGAIVTIIFIFHFGQIFESAFFLETPCSCRHQWWLLAFHSDGQQVKCNWAITNRCSALQLGNQPDFPFYNPSSDVRRLPELIFCKMLSKEMQLKKHQMDHSNASHTTKWRSLVAKEAPFKMMTRRFRAEA